MVESSRGRLGGRVFFAPAQARGARPRRRQGPPPPVLDAPLD